MKKMYKQLFGTAMRNSLSLFMGKLFMGKFKNDLIKGVSYFPKTWIRYVDDIFVDIDINKIERDRFIETLNSRFTLIKFSYETEIGGKLPFIDALVLTKYNGVEFDTY